ncbi:hypothetical protein G4177_02495 [Corallococcus sp. ZKHCc1 1396]|uniref:Uncharacterized protein n=1 Tax=Corallococcus soli TaxID=2710757 RepID=A0ABR9PGK7_9BACT|nr:hypothetical protein [Corallococcus soli]
MRSVRGALALLALVLAPPAGATDAGVKEAIPPRFEWPRLQVLEHVEASEIVEAEGVPVALRAVRVKENARVLVQRFADAFRDQGLYVAPGRKQAQLANNAAMLTAFDPLRAITYTVILQPQPDGTTSLYLGEANHALAKKVSAAGDFAPLPSQARDVLRVNSEGSRTLSFQTSLTGEQVQAFYDDALAKAGWKPADEPGLYTRPGGELRLTHEPGKTGQRAVVLLYVARAR